jgi:hypothetical protein
MSPENRADLARERARRINLLNGVRDQPDHPLAERTRVWALRCLAILDQIDAGSTRLRTVCDALDAEETRLGAEARAYRL